MQPLYTESQYSPEPTYVAACTLERNKDIVIRVCEQLAQLAVACRSHRYMVIPLQYNKHQRWQWESKGVMSDVRLGHDFRGPLKV